MVDLRIAVLGALAFSAVQASSAALPAWWQGLSRLERLESSFVQTSDSSVFGSLQRSGKLSLAKGGRIRVAYAKGLLLVADGKNLIQFDPGARTAQSMNLRSTASDMPLLNVLIDLKALETSYRVLAENDKVKLEPKRTGLPKVELEGKGVFLSRVTWVDGTGAKQVLELKDPHTPGEFPAGTFEFKAPAGTRWIGRK